MSGTFQIRRIQLLNFHNFVDETLTVRRNLFLMGDNQSGKTTVLDAIHFALSAGVEMEFNAATRFGPRTEPGRNLASIILRYDLERDAALRGPSITYSAIELEDSSGERSCFGAGAYASSLDSQPEVWGFVARGCSLEDLNLVVDEAESRRRPRDRQELEDVLGRGSVLEKGRYRSALAQFLFRDREAYLQALDLVGAAKSYRELVARSRNLNDLFVELLPPPAEEEFEEVRSALRAIEGIRGNFVELDNELAVLRRVFEKLQEARREHEKAARYEYVGAELARRQAGERQTSAEQAEFTARQDASAAEQLHSDAAERVRTLESGLRALRASTGFTLLEREDEARRDLAAAEGYLQVAGEEAAFTRSEVERAGLAAAQARARLEDATERAARALRAISETVREYLPEPALLALSSLVQGIAAPEPSMEGPHGQLLRAFQARRDLALGAAALAEDQAATLRRQAAQFDAEADQVRRRAEILPDLPGYRQLLGQLEQAGSRAEPLYRFFALAEGVPEQLGAAIECVLGPRVLGAIVAPPGEQPAVRLAVLRHASGVEVLDPAELPETAGTPAESTLPAALALAHSGQAAATALAWLRRIAGDVEILAAGDARGGHERAIWADGHIYESGAESRVEPAAPRFLGAEARRAAAAAEERRLRAESAHHAKLAEASSVEVSAQREVAAICLRGSEELAACAPTALLGLAREVRLETQALRAREAALDRAMERVSAAETRRVESQRRHAELAAAVAQQGLADLRSRMQQLESELDRARESQGDARAELGRRQDAAEMHLRRLEEARLAFETATQQMERKKEALLPLVAEARNRADIEDYAFRVMRGNQIHPGNVPDLVQEALSARARAFEALSASDGIRHEVLWQRYALRLSEPLLEIRDQAGRPVEDIFSEREEQVRALREALDAKTRDLLERVVMAGLVRRLQNQTLALRETVRGVSRLAADLRFGESRFQFSIRPRPEFERLLELLREHSVLRPALREELREFFQARMDDLGQARDREVPEILDYRRWFDYVLQVTSRPGGGPSDLARHRLRFGSGGEQAVPAYLLIVALASLLYDQTGARLRLLLLDEAFLGIDAGRREVLLQFAGRAGVDLVVATPELDGLTPVLEASSTLFIEKSPAGDVYVSDFHWQRPSPQTELFEEPQPLREQDWTLGVPPAPDEAGP